MITGELRFFGVGWEEMRGRQQGGSKGVPVSRFQKIEPGHGDR